MIIFLSPHNDDETLFGAYTLIRRKPLVVVVTDSWIQYNRGERITPRQRIEETKQAMKILDVPVEFLNIKDTELSEEVLKSKLMKYNPDKVYAPLPNSKNHQHNLIGRVAKSLWPKKVIFYSTYTADNLTPQGEIEIVPTKEEVELKNRALDCYKSQIRINNNHFIAVRNKSEYLNNPDAEKVTAVLLSWKRPNELKEIIKHLETIEFIDEILVWKNTSVSNKINYGRYLGALKAKNDIIYTQDDDCIVENIEEIYTTFDGKHLSNGIKPGAMRHYGSQKGSEPYSTVMGWGSFFKKEWFSVLNKYIERYGEDYLFYREADRIFSVLLCRRHNTIPVRIRDFPSATSPAALYHQSEHIACMNEAIRKAKEITLC